MSSKFASLAALGMGLLASSSTASAASDFAGPANWSKVDVQNPTPTRTTTQWHISGDHTTSVTYTQDTLTTFDDTVGAITKNFTANNIKATSKDLPCHGATARVIEFTAGPDGAKTIFNRMIVPQGSGVAMITYTRGDGYVFDDDVKKAETAFCTTT